MRSLSTLLRGRASRLSSRHVARSFSTSAANRQRQVYLFGRTVLHNLVGEEGMAPVGDPTPVKLPPKSWSVAAAGWLQNFVLSDAGELWCWGKNEHGQLGMPYRRVANVDDPEQNMSFAKVKLRRVAAARCHTLFQTADGILLSCGNNEVGQLGIGIESEEGRDSPSVIELLRGKQIVDFSVGLDHSVAVSADGKVYSWGFGPDGQLGFGNDENKPAPSEVPGLTNIVAVGCGLDHSIVVDGTGALWSFGRNDLGQLGLASTADFISTPTRVEIPGVKIAKVACGGVHSVALSSSGVVYTWGGGASGRLGHGSDQNSETPMQVTYFMEKNIKIVDISVGGGHNLALSEDGRLFGWGFGQDGRLGLGDDIDRQQPVLIKFFERKKVISMACGLDHSLVIADCTHGPF